MLLFSVAEIDRTRGAKHWCTQRVHYEKTEQSAASLQNLRGLYVITDAVLGGGHIAIAQSAFAGGARILQFRDKSGRSVGDILRELREVQILARRAGATLLVNDRLDWALAAGADGVHLGPDDMPVADARAAVAHLQTPFIIGASCGTPDEASAACDAGADYIGAGAIFGTLTKHDAGAAIGLDALAEIVAASSRPVAAIGGVNGGNIQSVLQRGAAMACVVSAIAAAGDDAAMTVAAAHLVQLCREAQQS